MTRSRFVCTSVVLFGVAACSGDKVTSEPEDGGTDSGSSAGGTSGQVGSGETGGTGGTGGETGDAAGGASAAAAWGIDCPIPAQANPVDETNVELTEDSPSTCPADFEDECVPDDICTYRVPCQSQVRELAFTCSSFGALQFGGDCDVLYDSCPIIEQYCNPAGWDWTSCGHTDEPPVCPWDRPEEGTKCSHGLYGGPSCGFYCDDGETWTIAKCEWDPPTGAGGSTSSHWEYDDACRTDCGE